MRKTTFALGLGLALSVGAADLAAQQQRPARPDSAKAGAAPGQRAMRGARAPRMQRGPQGHGMLLKGITLTDAQRAQLRAHRDAQHDTMRVKRDSARQAMETARAARQRGDTAALRAMRTQREAAMVQQREREIAYIRSILTAEQRTQFDRNVAEMKQRMENRAANARGRRPAGR